MRCECYVGLPVAIVRCRDTQKQDYEDCEDSERDDCRSARPRQECKTQNGRRAVSRRGKSAPLRWQERREIQCANSPEGCCSYRNPQDNGQEEFHALVTGAPVTNALNRTFVL